MGSSQPWSFGKLVLQGSLALLAYAIVTLPWERELSHTFKRVHGQTYHSMDMDEPTYTRSCEHFISKGDKIEAWLYLPKRTDVGNSTAPPVIIMAHGLGAQKDFGLHKYAERFVGGGLAVLLFDYRGFGGSDGEPRHWISPRRHTEDWEAAVNFVLGGGLGDRVNNKRVALWGSSYAGGHVLVTAAKFGENITCVVSQVPHLDGAAASKNSMKNRGLLGTIRFAIVAIHDHLRGLLGLPGVYVKLVGGYDELAMMQLGPEELASYFSKHPKEKLGGWQPKGLARMALETTAYSPIKHLPKIKAPVQFISATQDSLCLPEIVKGAAESMGDQATLLEYHSNHFDIYRGDIFEDSVNKMLEFMHKHLDEPTPKA